MKLAVFPLPIFLLPGGKTTLRIFEQRYLRMVKEAAGGEGFALSVYDKSQPYETNPWAAHVKVTDFDQAEEGLLIIDVEAQGLVKLSDIHFEHDNLRRATCTPIEHWDAHSHDSKTLLFAEQLRLTIEENQVLEQLYPQPDYSSPTWVCARMLELLPLPMEEKYHFIAPQSYQKAVQFLNILFEGQKLDA